MIKYTEQSCKVDVGGKMQGCRHGERGRESEREGGREAERREGRNVGEKKGINKSKAFPTKKKKIN